MPNNTNTDYNRISNSYNPFANPRNFNNNIPKKEIAYIPKSPEINNEKFRAENFYRNANFILTLFLSGVALSSMALYGTVVKKNQYIAKLNAEYFAQSLSETETKNNFGIVDDIYATADNLVDSTNVLGANSQNLLTLSENLTFEGTQNLKKGVETQITIKKLESIDHENDLRVVYFRKNDLMEISSPEMFELPDNWLAVPFDYESKIVLKIVSNFQGNFLLNLFDNIEDSSVNLNVAGNLGYIEFDSEE